MHNRNKLYVVIKTFHLRLTFNTPCIILENKFPVELVRILIFSWTFKLTTSKNMTVLERITEEQQKNRPSFPCSQFGVLRAVYKDWDVSVESFSAQNYLIATQWCFFFFFSGRTFSHHWPLVYVSDHHRTWKRQQWNIIVRSLIHIR